MVNQPVIVKNNHGTTHGTGGLTVGLATVIE